MNPYGQYQFPVPPVPQQYMFSDPRQYQQHQPHRHHEKPPCPYGANCYRKNPEHFKEYSHPPGVMERNLSSPPPPPPPAGYAPGPRYEQPPVAHQKPPCPYGANCYRKNSEHFMEYSHPPGVMERNLSSPPPPLPAAARYELGPRYEQPPVATQAPTTEQTFAAGQTPSPAAEQALPAKQAENQEGFTVNDACTLIKTGAEFLSPAIKLGKQVVSWLL